MSTMARRTTSPLSDMFDWLENVQPLARLGASNYLRLEDFVEDDTYVVRAEMPGIDPDKDIDVNLDNGVLTIRAERREEERDKNHSEFHYGAFERSMRLPSGAQAEDIVATYKDGVLEIRVPARETPLASTQRIPIQRSAG